MVSAYCDDLRNENAPYKKMTTTKMSSESQALPTQTEKPPHYTYLKEFRTQQCPLFLQHKCTQHRPFTCFHWHFMNQRRRRPVRKRDGTFNYSPDIYCTKFDETTGICPDGDECPFLHRTAGDTERRYHLRYYKTGTCVYETDTKGNCVKNGPHCAFAHGPIDLRAPVYDIREMQAMEQNSDISSSPGTPSSGSLEKDRLLLEDPRWNDTNFVLANYKTETCKKPPRLCRQGYACPHFHNARDRRRTPKIAKYRSTPCPNVKHGDDWGDPTQCENGDNCGYCHTRTEQQFHPEIYKSTKCNDMVQTNFCPRGAFCAFAHVEQEITTQREIIQQGSSFLAAMISNLLPASSVVTSNMGINLPVTSLSSTCSSASTLQTVMEETTTNGVHYPGNSWTKMPDPIGKERTNSTSGISILTSSSVSSLNNSYASSPLPEPIGKGRSSSLSSSITSTYSNDSFYTRSSMDRDDINQVINQIKLRQQLKEIDQDPNLDSVEKAKRKQNLMLVHNLGSSGAFIGFGNNSMSLPNTTMSPFATAFYPPRDTVGSVIEHGLEDITLDDIDINNLDKEFDNDTNSLSSSISAGLSSGTGFQAFNDFSNGFGSTSIPIGIPPCNIQRGSIGSLSQSPTSPYGSFPHAIIPLQTQKESHTESYLGHHNHMKFSGSPFAEVNSMSPRSGPMGLHSPLYSQSVTGVGANGSASGDISKLLSDVNMYKTKLEHWEQAYNQAKAACEAWKKEAEDSSRKVKTMEDEKNSIVKQRDEALKKLKQDSSSMKTAGTVLQNMPTSAAELDAIMLPQLHHLRHQLKSDLEKIDQVIYKATKCVICQESNRCIATSPCNHCATCEKCAPSQTECPMCHAKIVQRVAMNYQL
ncbi:RING finger protein unkempt-like isoform X2 [Dreissena polymorpha]|uniref:RING finger protein unkempt-like isoform X2 n=1 Tax=Dreissena polymorpha TaxID=45954 RepID=UPI0022644D7D|nr:RING finger protein unkempt-like isoform X2 [Dreissena polymorpha]